MAILGMWVWPGSVRQHGAEKVAESCARAKVTDIFFLTKGLMGTTAYHGSFAPRCCECDLLREIMETSHRYGIRVHAWLTSACDENFQSYIRPADAAI